MEQNTKYVPPLGLRIFALIYVLKNTLPVILVSILKLLHREASDTFSFVLSSLSTSAGKMLMKVNYPFSLSLMLLIISLIVLFVFYKFWVGNLLKKKLSKNWLFFLRLIAILYALLLVLKMFAGGAGYGTGEWNSAINVLLTLGLDITFIIYLFTKQARNFFTINKDNDKPTVGA